MLTAVAGRVATRRHLMWCNTAPLLNEQGSNALAVLCHAGHNSRRAALLVCRNPQPGCKAASNVGHIHFATETKGALALDLYDIALAVMHASLQCCTLIRQELAHHCLRCYHTEIVLAIDYVLTPVLCGFALTPCAVSLLCY